jgi:basic membrane lipoprotein Med (substrate-binding protein (PBP1-ABC) superfamily)
MLKSKLFGCIFVVVLVLGIVAIPCWAQAKTASKVGFIYTGSATDCGWNNAHDNGRQFLESTMKGQVITTRAENIPENSSSERVMEKMIAQGNKVIFVTSYGFLEPALKVAKRHPDVRFMHCGRMIPPGVPNVGSYFSTEYYEYLYASGVVAGKMTRTNKLAFVGGHPIPALIWCVNAFALGARSVNPKATVQVVWTNSWEDPAVEAEATRGLIERGCDVLASSLNSSLTVCRTAENAKAYSVGVSYDLHNQVPKGWLTGQGWNWGPLYVKVVKSIQDNSWKPVNLRYGSKDGYAILSPFGKSVPPSVQAQALKVVKAIHDGKLEVFPSGLKDRDGKLRLAANQKANSAWLDSMDFFVSGVEGTLPKH